MVRKNNPHVVRFLRDACIVETDAEALHKELWQTYCEWTHLKRMRRTLCLRSFYQQCRKVGFKPVSDKRGVVKWQGVMLKSRYSMALDVRHRNDKLDSDALS